MRGTGFALLLPLVLAGCLTGENKGPVAFTGDRGVADQPYPANAKPEILAFMKTYLNNPAGLRSTGIAEPVQRTLGGRLRYVICLRYAERDPDRGYPEPRARGIVFVDGRLDRLVEQAEELCASQAYAPFPELASLTR